MKVYKANLSFLVLSSTCLMSSNVFAVDQTINLNNQTYPAAVIATNLVAGTSFDNVIINVNNSNFGNSLQGNRNKTIVNQTLNFNSGNVTGFIAGLTRSSSNLTPKGFITGVNTINVSGGTILSHVTATIDEGGTPAYSGTDRRRQNVINFSGGNIQGNIVGGAGADENIINITGGTLGKLVGGVFKSSLVQAGVGNLANKSTNSYVFLKNMNNSNSFLSTFVETTDSSGGVILGGLPANSASMNFTNVNGTYQGGIKNFDNLIVDSLSNVVFGGKSYFADNWTVAGVLNTNGKTLHSYKTNTIQLAVNAGGTLTSQFISDANVTANNAGIINGIQTTKNIAVNNTGVMSGNYSGAVVNVVNSGKINDATHTQTTITSTNPGILTNYGQIGADAGSVLTMNGSTSLSNELGGKINGQVILNNTVSSFVNHGIIGASAGTSGTYQIINNSTLTQIANDGVIGGIGSISSVVPLALNNNAGGLVTGSQTLNNVNLINMSGAFVQDAYVISDTGAIVVINNGTFSGTNRFASLNGGTYTLNNQTSGLMTGSLIIQGGLNGSINNTGAMSDLHITNHQNDVALENTGIINGIGAITSDSLLILNNNLGGLITGTQTLENVNLSNASGALVQNANLISDTTPVAIINNGTFDGTNTLSGINGGTFSFDNHGNGLITGSLDVKSGLDAINNEGTINNLVVQSEQDNLTIDNSGLFTGNNTFISDKKITLNNQGNSDGNVSVIAKQVDVIQNSTSALTTNFYGNLAGTELSFDNRLGSKIDSGLFNQFDTLNISNEDTEIATPAVMLTNNGSITSNVNLKNKGNVKLSNNGSITAAIQDAYFDVVQDCLDTIFQLDNANTVAGNISILNNKFILNNSGLITSTHIDTKDLMLDNSGTFDSAEGYLFSVQDYINANNTGYIYSKDMAFMFTGNKTSGTITNSGTIWSEGTTIGFADTLTPCPGGCGYTGSIDLYNTGKIVSVDPTNLTIPNLNSYAINADNMNVFNQAGGLIGGSILANNYTQNAGATWVTFLDKDQEVMSTITVKENVSIDQGAILYIYTNNNVSSFKDDDSFLVIKTDPQTSTMTDNEIYTELNKFTLKSDSPFANYQMIGYDRNGYIVFNNVAASTYVAAADVSTANHTNIAMGAHRFYELFVNRNVSQTQDMLSSVGKPKNGTGLYFMPMTGHAVQDNKAGHTGYSNTYYGGVGYLEHDFDNNVKAGIGMAYLYNDNKYSDAYNSDGYFNTYRPFAYLNYEPGKFRADIAAGYARHNVHDNRKYKFNDTIYTAESDYYAEEFSGHLNLGYKVWDKDGIIIQPMIGAHLARLSMDSYTEKGAGPMNMHLDSENYDSVRSMLGLKMSKEYTRQQNFAFIPELHLRWYHELADTQGTTGAYFLAQGEWFNAKGIQAARDIGDVAVRVTTKSNMNLDLFTEIYYQFSQDFYNLGGTVGIQYHF